MRESLINFKFNHFSLFFVSVNEIKMRILRISRFSFQPSNAHDASHQARLEREQARVRWLSLECWNNSADAWRSDSKARGQQSQHQGGQRYQTIENWWVAQTLVELSKTLQNPCMFWEWIGVWVTANSFCTSMLVGCSFYERSTQLLFLLVFI